MQINIGMLDRSIRAALGVVIIVVGIIYQSYWGILGFLPLITSAIGFCPVYYLFGWSTVPKKKRR